MWMVKGNLGWFFMGVWFCLLCVFLDLVYLMNDFSKYISKIYWIIGYRVF